MRTKSEYVNLAFDGLQTCTVTITTLSRPRIPLTPQPAGLCQARRSLPPRAEWIGEAGKGITNVTASMRYMEITHALKIQDFENWLIDAAEIVLKDKVAGDA